MSGVPFDGEAERAVMGAILLQNEAMDEIADVVASQDFYKATHRAIYEAMVSIHAKKEAIDMLSLSNVLKARGELEECGGLAFLASLDSLVSSINAGVRFARRVRDMATRRALITAAVAAIDDARDDTLELDAVLSAAESAVLTVRESNQTSAKIVSVAPSVRRVFASLEARYERGEAITGIASGYPELDGLTTGFHDGELIVIGARSGFGKTTIGMNIAGHVSMDLAKPVLVFSLEMGQDSLVERLLGSEARVDSQRMRTGKLLETDWPKIARACDRLYRSRLYINDASGSSVADMRSCARRVKKDHGLSLIVLDYLQLASASPDDQRGSMKQRRSGNRQEEVAEISRGLKGLARDLNVPVIALAQINRAVDTRKDKRPLLSDLRESGAIENDADLVVLLYRDDKAERDSKVKGEAEIIIAKQRNGPCGVVKLDYRGEFGRFDNPHGTTAPSTKNWNA